MSNDEMRPGRFLKLQNGKRMLSAITNHLKSDGTVLVCTYTRATKLSKKHLDMVRMGKSGSVYIQAGKRWDCIDGCGIRLV
jgi:hypothetical protein